MLRDDRMMGMLTFVVILLAVGTFVQRYEGVQRLFGFGGSPIELNADTAMAQPGQLVAIDVLANDVGVEPGDADRLTILARPDCGRAFVRNGTVNYLGDSDCAGPQAFRYGLAGDEAAGAVRVSVAMTDPKQGPVAEDNRAAAAPPEPAPAAASPTVELAQPPATLAAPAPEGGSAPGPGGGVPAAGAGDDESSAIARAEPGSRAPARPGAEPGAAATPAPATPAPGTPAPDGGAAAPSAPGAGTCTLPPALTLEAGPGAMTEVIVDSPCHATGVAELAYDGLRFAIPLDSRGAGSLAVPGFERTSQAELTFAGGETLDFELAFRDVERAERVAVVWEAPSGLSLTALEFGARPGGTGHVRPDRPRSFEEARRDGGGWLASYQPAGDAGQRIDVYTYWRRYGAPSGVVKLGLAPEGEGDAQGACAGETARPADYLVLRSTGGRPERARLGRVAPLDCTVLAGRAAPAIGDAVDDLIVRRR